MAKKKIIKCMAGCTEKLVLTTSFFSPFANLFIRFWVGLIFWQSGVLKLESWDTTLMLFEDEHPVPYLPVEFAAILGTTMELIMPIMLFIGLGARFAAFNLLFMTFVIQYSYMNSAEHAIWAMMLFIILVQGAGKFSWDYLIKRKYMKKSDSDDSDLQFMLSIIMVFVLTIFSAHEIMTVAFESWETPWFDSLSAIWVDIDKWLGSFYRE